MKRDMFEIKKIWHMILNKLNAECCFADYLSGDLDYFKWRYDVVSALPEGVWCATGATRMVFGLDDNHDYVFKILKDRSDIDYNASEAFIYERACQAQLEEWFAWTEKVETIEVNGTKTDIYVMDFCEVNPEALEANSFDTAVKKYLADNNTSLEEMSEEEKEQMYDWLEEDSGSPEGICHYMYSIYDAEEMNALYDFIDHYRINDTHCGNWGWRGEHMVLIDFGGFERNIMERCHAE